MKEAQVWIYLLLVCGTDLYTPHFGFDIYVSSIMYLCMEKTASPGTSYFNVSDQRIEQDFQSMNNK